MAVGSGALFTQSYANSGNTWNSGNVAVGYQALNKNQPTSSGNGFANTALGWSALLNNTTGAGNTAIGASAGSNLTTGNNNIDIGNGGLAGENNTIRIGDGTQTDSFFSSVLHANGLRSTANTGIITVAPVTALDVSGSGWFRSDSGSFPANASRGVRVFYDSGQGVGNIFAYNYGAGGGALNLELQQNGGNVGIATATPAFLLTLAADSAGKPNGGSWANTSDRRVKFNIEPMQNALERLTQLRGVTFSWRNPEDHANQTGRQAGFVAQEVESVFPNWVTEVDASPHDRALTDGKTKSLSLPFEFDALVVESIKQQQAQISSKDNEIAALKQEVAELKAKEKARDARLARLEQQIK